MPAPALIFDLDDTLIPSQAIYGRVLGELGVPTDRYHTARSLVKGLLGDGHVAARNRLLYFKRLLEAQDQATPERILELMNRYESLLTRACAEEWKRLGRANALRKLKAQYRLYLLTNENLRTQLLKLTALDPAGELFSGILTSEEVGFEKPHFRTFETLLQRFALRAVDCTFIGDDWENDIAPALALGMRAIWTQEFAEIVSTAATPTPGLQITRALNETLETLAIGHHA